MAALDATNLTISFVAPASGDVLVRLSGSADTVGASNYWGLCDHTTLAQVGFTACVASITYTTIFAAPAFLITGLVAGNIYQYDWAGLGTVANLTVQGATGAPSQPNAGPAVMEVWAA
jgi:hypothetical protein